MNQTTALETKQPHKKPRLRRNFSWMAVGQSVFLLCQWAMFAILAKAWSAELVGQLSLAMAITSPIFRFSHLGMRIAQATDVQQDYRFGDYFGLRSFCGVMALLILVGIIGGIGYAMSTAVIIGLVGLVRVIDGEIDIFYGLFQSVERMDYIARSMMMRGFLSVTLFTFCLFLTDSLAAGVVGWLVATLTLFLVHDLRLGRSIVSDQGACAESNISISSPWHSIRPTFNWKVMGRLAWLTLPLGLVDLLVALQINIPRYIISDHFGLEELGYFAAMMYFFVAAVRLMNTLGHSASARLARQYANGERRAFVKLLAKLTLFALVVSGPGLLIVTFAGEQILTILYTAEYAAYPTVFLLIMIAAVLRFIAILLQFGVSAARQFRVQFWNHLVIILVALAGSYFLIPTAGMFGAGVVVLLTAACHLCAILIVSYRTVRALTPPQPAS